MPFAILGTGITKEQRFLMQLLSMQLLLMQLFLMKMGDRCPSGQNEPPAEPNSTQFKHADGAGTSDSDSEEELSEGEELRRAAAAAKQSVRAKPPPPPPEIIVISDSEDDDDAGTSCRVPILVHRPPPLPPQPPTHQSLSTVSSASISIKTCLISACFVSLLFLGEGLGSVHPRTFPQQPKVLTVFRLFRMFGRWVGWTAVPGQARLDAQLSRHRRHRRGVRGPRSSCMGPECRPGARTPGRIRALSPASARAEAAMDPRPLPTSCAAAASPSASRPAEAAPTKVSRSPRQACLVFFAPHL